MNFFSHSKTNDNGYTYGSKLLSVHICGVTKKALLQHSANSNIVYNSIDLNNLIRIISSFHDLGKYTTYFQNYLLHQKPIDSHLKQHSRVGGFAAYNYLVKTDKKQGLLALYVILLHHSSLDDIQQITRHLNQHVQKIVERQVKDLKSNAVQIENETMISNVGQFLYYPDEEMIRKDFKFWAKRQSSIEDYYLINYLFSLLIESDKLDASDTTLYQPIELPSDSVDKRFGIPKPNGHDPNLKRFTNNEIREYCRSEVIASLARADIQEHSIFTLTAPTGTGKTMMALDFALKLKEKVSVLLGSNVRIIYALPFINIIEQALEEYEKTLPKETQILAHYQYSEVFSSESDTRADDGYGNYRQRLMTLDTWQCDIVITSFVQFFETLIGNRNKLLKKFNHFANSIVILDEVQTLRLDQMPLIGASLFYLSKFLHTKLILMTATKPKIFELAESHILANEGEKVRPLELLPSYKEVFSALARTKIVPLINIEISSDSSAQDFIKNIFANRWKPDKSCIIVCNTVRRSIEIHDELVSWFNHKGFNNKIEYLSTNIIPADRFTRIKALANEIQSEKAPILVSTQVVEAGVDLDFDMGFRDIGPIDSIIQVAGRINRNNKVSKQHSPLFIVDFGDAKKIYGRITYDQAKSALIRRSEFLEADYLDLVSGYFDNISDRKSFSQFNKIFESMKSLRYDSEDSEGDRPVSCFKIIEESEDTQAVFIEISDYETILRDRYEAKIKRKISNEEFNKKYKLDFQQRIISIPSPLSRNLPSINIFDNNIRVVTLDTLSQYYCRKTGFIRKADQSITFL